jgi:starvation-inducible DNA-binding protein
MHARSFTETSELYSVAKKPANSTAPLNDEAQPRYAVEYREIQQCGMRKDLPMDLEDNARPQSV